MMDVFCGPLSNVNATPVDADAWWQPRSAHCHVDLVNILATCGFASFALTLVFYLRAYCFKSDPHASHVHFQWHSFRGVVVVLSLLTLLVDLSDALLAPRRHVHVLATSITTLVAWLIDVVFHYHVETRRRPGFLLVSVLGWTLCSVSRIVRLLYFLSVGLDENTLGVVATASVATSFVVLALIDVSAVCAEFCGERKKVYNEHNKTFVYRHYVSNFFSRVTFFWLTSLLRIGSKNPLELDNLGDLPKEETTHYIYNQFRCIYDNEKKERDKKISLWRCYMKNSWRMFALGGLLKLLGDCISTVGPLGISVIIDYVAKVQTQNKEELDPDENYYHPTLVEFINNGYVMSVIIFVSALAQSTFSQCSTHLVNVEGIHIKGALQALVYDKALRLCVWNIKDTDQSSGVAKKSSSNTDVGAITNLMSEDVFNVMSFFWIGHYIWAIPLKIGVIMYFLYLKLGNSALIGAAVCILTMTPLQFLVGKKMSSNSKAITELSDERLRKVNEVLQGIKLLKLYAWECVYGLRIAETRKRELALLDKDSLYWALMTFLTQASSVLVTLVTFGVYFMFENKSLSAGNVFASLALFNQLTVPLFIFPITVPIIISARLSTKRLENFLALPETSNPTINDPEQRSEVNEVMVVKDVAQKTEASTQKSQDDNEDRTFRLGNIMENEEEPDEEDDNSKEDDMVDDHLEDVAISVDRGCFSWTGDGNLSLSMINTVVATGKLTLVVGKVGSGKTSLLSALLGEMHVNSGKVHWRSDLTVAYVAQKPWLLNATLRDNILYGEPYRPRWYDRVISACALQPDIDILPGKDLTEIGEKGITLSGGQKQRVSIARALYRRATIVIMDDPLSALDDQVAQQVFENGIKRLLLRQRRTVILVTHRLQLLVHAHKIIALENGKIRVQGSLADIESSDHELAKAWKAIVTREALEEKAKGRTAKERWQLIKLVSRIGVQLKQRNDVADGSWQPEEQTLVSTPSFVPFRRRLGTFSGSRYFSHDLPLPTDECEEDFVMRPTRPSVKRNRASITSTPPGISSLPQHKLVLRSSSLQMQDNNLPYPVVRQFSSPSIQRDPLLPGPCRSRNYTIDNANNAPLLRRLLSMQARRTVTSMSELPTPTSVKEPNVLKRLLSSTGLSKPAPIVKAEPLRIKRLQSTVSTYSDDYHDEDEYDNSADPTNGRLVTDEEREYGKIPRRIYFVYLCSCGVTVGLAYILLTIAWQALKVYTDVWLSYWTDNDQRIARTNFTNSTLELVDANEPRTFFVVYAVLSVTSIFLSLSSNGIGQYAGAQARRSLHDKMLLNLLRCPIRFFETTPVGRIINRFSTDMAVIDKKIATSIQRLLQFLLLCFSGILVNAVVSPWFLFLAVPICIIYFLIQRFYRCSARELQRLDSITRSPIFSHFSETLGGLTTIRAFSHQQRFTEMLHKKMDSHSNVFLIINSGNRWLGIALDYLGGVIVFVAILASLISASYIPSITPALVGLAINYTFLIPIYLNWVVKFLSDMEMYMSAVERIQQYSQITTDDYREQGISVPFNWPEKGDIVFTDVSLRYDTSRAPVVTNLNLHIPAGQKVGVCGRSGSGKSSLVMSLFNMIDVCEGSIKIDNVDIKLIPLQVLRSRLSIIPQDVLMFSGSIRSNLDPKSQYSDDKLWTSLELAQLKDIVTKYPGGLDGEVREGGENLSAGERQLFCLARAILHDAACLVMDEATSSIDPGTEKSLLVAATRAFASRTVITIAHRLPTILECDRILVLDDGKIVEDGTPTQLLNRSMGIFSSMLRASEEGTIIAT